MKPHYPTILLILLVSSLFSACLPLLHKQEYQKEVLFRDNFMEVREIDEKYATDFREEGLGKVVVDLNSIDPMKEEILVLVEQITGTRYVDLEVLSKKKNKTETDLALLLLGIRLEMLDSEKYFQLGYQYGNKGLVGDGFFCDEKPFIDDATANFRRSLLHGLNVTYHMDILLTQTKNVTHDLIGVDENKPKFYETPLQTMFNQLRQNEDIVMRACANATDERQFYLPNYEDSKPSNQLST